MTEKLRSHLRREKGFTLVELLIVIAIIAILVLLVIVALDPLERLRDTSDRDAQNSVRQAGAAIAACVTKEISAGVPEATALGALGPCGSAANLAANDYISNAAALGGVTTWTFTGADACVLAANPGGHHVVGWAFSLGVVSDPENPDADFACP